MTDDLTLQLFFEEAAEAVRDLEEGLLRIEHGPQDGETLNRILRGVHTLKGTGAMLGFEVIVRFAHVLEDALLKLRGREDAPAAENMNIYLAAADILRALLQRARDQDGREVERLDEVTGALRALGGTPQAAPGRELVGGPGAENIEAVGNGTSREGGEPEAALGEAATIRVATERVDRLVDLVGELVITQSMVAKSVSTLPANRGAELEGAVAEMGRHVRALQDRVMAVRMLPIRVAFGRVRRAVRDLAQTLGKQVELDTSGEDTELDKSVIEQISDPLLHLARNAVDHGIEPPEERRLAGKSEAGRLGLRAYQQGGGIYVEISDDGRGLDRARILATAAAAGLLPEQDRLNDEQVFDLIFRPGFTTAERVTEVSGRGIGMDVVKRNVGLLGGSIAIHSERGRGTTFKLKLPLTLAILDGQTLRAAGQTYILPLASIVESARARGGDFRVLPGGGEVMTIRGEAIPVFHLARLVGSSAGSDEPGLGLVVIVEDEGRQIGLAVDELLDQQQVVIKSLEANFRKLEGIAGATVLGDGRVALILDVPGLVALGRSALHTLSGSAGRGANAIAEASR
jgi:two-component system chemotaxis sensor kinase CheA